MFTSRRLILTAISSLLAATCHATPRSDVAVAAADGDVAALLRIFDSGRAVDVRDLDGLTPLIWAAREGRVDAVRALIAHGASPDLPDARGTGWTPLMHAIHRRQPQAVAALLDGGARPDLRTASGFSPLMMAAGYGQTETVELLLRHGASPRLRDDRGENALDLALTGVSDIDDFSLVRCQDDTTRAILAADPKIPFGRTSADRVAAAAARVKGCAIPKKS